MAEVLSQTEIDALLAAVSTGAVDTGATEGQAENEPDWVAYDLTSSEKIVHNRMVALQGIHERFIRLLRVSLSSMLKKNVSVSVMNTDFIRFGEYLGNILLPTSINVISVPSLNGYMMFVMSSKLTYALVDAYYGGNERPFSKIGGREQLTSIETNMIKKICQTATKDLEDAWRLNYPLSLQYMKVESNPQFVGYIHGSEMVAVVTFEVEFENLSGPFSLAIQLRALEPIQHALAVNVMGEYGSENEEWKKHWMEEIYMLPLDMRVELGSFSSTLRKVNQFKKGEEVILMQDAAGPLSVAIEGVPKVTGLMGTYRGNTAVRVVDRILTKEEKKT